jgi:hypothetical protein
MESEDRRDHLRLGHSFVGHQTLGLRAQSGDHGDRIAHLGQGCLDPLAAPGGNLSHGPLGRVIHLEQCLARVREMGPVKESSPRSNSTSWRPGATILKPPEATFLGEGMVMGDEPTPAQIRSTIVEELSSKGERRGTIGGSPTIIPRTVPLLDNSSRVGRHAPLLKGLRTKDPRRGSLHHEDQTTEYYQQAQR